MESPEVDVHETVTETNLRLSNVGDLVGHSPNAVELHTVSSSIQMRSIKYIRVVLHN